MSIKLNYLVNLKSGMCPESCTCCSQSLGSKAEILRYSWLSTEEAMEQVGKGIDGLPASASSPAVADPAAVTSVASVPSSNVSRRRIRRSRCARAWASSRTVRPKR